jgi:tetratricopeptide (TPR) repeat protein
MTLNSRRAWFTVARMLAQSIRAFAAGALLAATATPVAGQAPSQTPHDVYRAALATYARTGDITHSVLPLQTWSRVEFDAAVKATIASKRADDLETGAILHLEIGVALVGISAPVAAGHIRYGSDLLDRWTATQPALKPAAVDDQKQFRSLWFGVAGSAFAAIKDTNRAGPLLGKALGAVPRSARVQTLMGTLREFDASQFNPEGAPTLARRERVKRERMASLYLAEQDYREALRYDPNYALAHIRLGRVLHLSGKLPDARASLERGRQIATEPLARYLGALFMGALQEDEKDIAGARRSLEQAVAIAPNSQPAVVALAHLEVVAGRPDRAHALARGLAEAPPTALPWWAFHNGGLDLTGLQSLRARAMR